MLCAGIEYWIESDVDIDEDIRDDTNRAPPITLSDSDASKKLESHSVVKWIVVLLSIFQSRFFVTNRAMTWLIKFFGILLTFLGKYSPDVASIASIFPSKMRHFNKPVEKDCQFERRAACVSCDSIYKFDDYLQNMGSIVSAKRCTFKPFKMECNELLMKEVITFNGNRRFYPHRVYCYSNLASDLQALVLRPGFIEQCEYTRKSVTDPSRFLDVCDGTIWKDFIKYSGSPFLSQCNNYGLLLNIDWLQPFDHLLTL